MNADAMNANPYHLSVRTDPRVWLYVAREDPDGCHFYTNNSAKALHFDTDPAAREYIGNHEWLQKLAKLGVLIVHRRDDRSQLQEVKHMRYGLDS